MTKLKSSLLSLGARGTIGDTLTLQKRGAATLIRTKPIPAYRYTLLQAYQRWLYEDYAYLWRQQTLSVRQAYASSGSRYHLTGFQYWMKVMLLTMPDIVGWWRLDEKAGAIAYDSTPDPHHGLIVGPSPGDGVINGSYFFDGLNDYITVNPAPIQTFTAITVLCFMKTPAFDGTFRRAVWWIDVPVPTGFQIFLSSIANTVAFYLYNTAGASRTTLAPYTPNTFELHGAVWDGTTLSAVRNSDLLDPRLIAGEVYPNAPLDIGASWREAAKYWHDGYQDNLIIYNRALDATEIARWAARRYPP